jgi:hypothetical protein
MRGVGVRVEVADVAEGCRAEQCVGDCVQDDVGVGVTGQPARVLDADAAEDERSAVNEAVRVVTGADAEHDYPPFTFRARVAPRGRET